MSQLWAWVFYKNGDPFRRPISSGQWTLGVHQTNVSDGWPRVRQSRLKTLIVTHTQSHAGFIAL